MNWLATQNQSRPMIKSSTFRTSMLALMRRYGYTRHLPWGYRALFLKEDWKYAVGGTPKGRSFPFRVTQYTEMLRYGVPTLRNTGMVIHFPSIHRLIHVNTDQSAGWKDLKTASKRHLILSPMVLGTFKWTPCRWVQHSSPVRLHDSACVGKNLATMELLLIVSTVIRRYEFRLITPDQKVYPLIHDSAQHSQNTLSAGNKGGLPTQTFALPRGNAKAFLSGLGTQDTREGDTISDSLIVVHGLTSVVQQTVEVLQA